MLDLGHEFTKAVYALDDAVSVAQMAVFRPLLEARGVQVVTISSQAELTALLAGQFQGAEEIRAAVDGDMEINATSQALERAGLVPLQTHQIRVVKAPAGEAPLEIRNKWQGVLLTPAIRLPPEAEGGEVNILSGAQVPAREAWACLPADAIRALSEQSPEAGAWFADQWPEKLKVMTFGDDEVEVVK